MVRNPIYKLLDAFIRRYYWNQLLKGLILFLAFGVGLFVLVSFLVGSAYLSPTVRTVLFYILITGEAVVIYKFFIIPILGLNKLGKHLGYKEASLIIGKHFPDVQDKLLNLLEFDENNAHDDLVVASIEQRTKLLSPIPFHTAIDFKENKKFIVYAVPTVVVLAIIFIGGYSMRLVEGSKRLAQHRVEFAPVAPFSFQIVQDEMPVVGKAYQLNFLATGDIIPNDAFLIIDGMSYPLSKNGSIFTHEINRLAGQFVCEIGVGEFKFGPFEIEPLFSPQIEELEIVLEFPSYTGIAKQIKNQFDNFRLPEGTKASFFLSTSHSGVPTVNLVDTSFRFIEDKGSYLFSKSFTENSNYQIVLNNANGLSESSDLYAIDVVKDAYPAVTASLVVDSVSFSGAYVEGFIEDDYGFSQFFWEITKDGKRIKKGVLRLPKSSAYYNFQYTIAFNDVSREELNGASFRLGISDNDGVNGPKTSFSSSVELRPKSSGEMRATSIDQSEAAISQMQSERQKLSESIQKMKQKSEELLQKKNPDWEEKQTFQDLLKEQNKIREQLEKLKQERKQQSQLDEEQNLFNEEILEKQKRIDDLLDKLLTDEMKDLMKEIEEMMGELNKDELREKLEQLEIENSQVNDELERYLELLEQLNFEKSLEETIKELQNLEDKQNELRDNDELSKEDNAEQQEQLNKDLEGLEKKLDELQEKDKGLKKPNGFEKPEEDIDSADKSMEKASEEMKNGKSSESKQQQKKASESLKKAKESLLSFQGGMAQQQNEENMENLRRILENLITLSTDQEQLLLRFGSISSSSPEFIELIKDQKGLQNNSKIIADSLFALSKRVEQIEPFINKEMKIIDRSFDKGLEFFSERELPKGRGQQQYVMTSTNNLALLLNDVLDQMQQQQASNMEGSQNCQKPGMGKPNMNSLKKMQQQLAEELGKMKGDGKGEGEGQKGKGRRGMSKEIVEMMAKQEKIREQLKSISQEQQGNQMQELLEQLEENEKDIANMKFDEAFYERQQEILTRLLEAENAELKQQQDNQRQGETAKKQNTAFTDEILEYLKNRKGQVESIRYDTPNFGLFYKKKQTVFY